ncbi:MAG TPA: winged helix-turn-helix domain-containing protein [Nitrosopumilaceae archaeon]|nr:winged helix-turn-helix domain-containing protein [Nitrosopumilaceae archaeon]
MEKSIKINRIVTSNSQQAKAIEDLTRSKILKILYKKQLTAEQILAELKKNGYNKALTTIRHHLDILKISGLIELVKIEESRGAITKFYGTSTKLLEYDIPKDFESKYSSLIKTTSGKMETLVKNISEKTSSKTKNQKSENTENYTQYLLMEIVNRALTNVLEKSH